MREPERPNGKALLNGRLKRFDEVAVRRVRVQALSSYQVLASKA